MTIRPFDFYPDRHYVPNAHRRRRAIRHLSDALVVGRPSRAMVGIVRAAVIGAVLLGVVVWGIWHG